MVSTENRREQRGVAAVRDMMGWYRQPDVFLEWTNGYAYEFRVGRYTLHLCDQEDRVVGRVHLTPRNKNERKELWRADSNTEAGSAVLRAFEHRNVRAGYEPSLGMPSASQCRGRVNVAWEARQLIEDILYGDYDGGEFGYGG